MPSVRGCIFFSPPPTGPFRMPALVELRALAFVALIAPVTAALADRLDDGAAAARAGDYKTAGLLWRGLAEEGNVDAQCRLGALYLAEDNPFASDSEAVKWSRKCADNGLAKGQSTLGWLYMLGRGVPQNFSEGARLLSLAAEAGDTWGQYQLGQAYRDGRGVVADLVVAYMWLSLASAAEKDNEQRRIAIKWRDLTAMNLFDGRLEEAQALSAAWKPGPEFPKAHHTYLERAKAEDYGITLGRVATEDQRYPRRAMTLGWQGTTIVGVQMSPEGRMRSLTIVKSSGYDILDQEALAKIQRIRTLPPIPDKYNGRPFTVHVPVTFSMK